MKRISRDTRFVIVILILFLILSVVSAMVMTDSSQKPMLSSRSTNPDGANALMLWLDELDYDLRDVDSDTFLIPESTSVLLMLQPLNQLDITDIEWQMIDRWVEGGGTFIIAGNNYRTHKIIQHYDFYLSPIGEPVNNAALYSPIMSSPPMATTMSGNIITFLETDRADYLTLVAVDKGPLAVLLRQGKGQVILTNIIDPFTNAGLKIEGNPSFVLNLLSLANSEGPVLFDEWHHGLKAVGGDVRGPGDWVLKTAAGRSILFAAAIIFLGLILSGRQFGKPVSPRDKVTKRRELDFITAVANLRQRGGHRQHTLMSYYKMIKREVGRRYRLDPTMDDGEFVSRLVNYAPPFDTAVLYDLLVKLQQESVSENSMVQLAAEADNWLNLYQRK